MGSTFLGDIESGALIARTISHASAASNAAAASHANIGVRVQRAAQNLTIVAAWQEPTGADTNAADAASYRVYSLVDGSTNGLGTRVLASVALTASQASNTTRALTLIAVPTVARGNVIYAAVGATVGGDHTGTVVEEGCFGFSYRPI